MNAALAKAKASLFPFSKAHGRAVPVAAPVVARASSPRGERLPLRETPWRARLAVPILGGAHVWSDLFVVAEWRVQQHALTGLYRLLDPSHHVRVSGSWEECRAEVPAGLSVPGHVTVLLHGLGCGHDMMEPLETALRGQGLYPVNLGYASLFRSLEQNAEALAGVLEALADHGARSVSFVAYSLGGLVLRRALGPDMGWRKRLSCGKAVLLGTPNQGCRLASLLALPQALRTVGPAGRAILPRHARALPVPGFPFAIVVAGQGTRRGLNPWLAGDNDGVVRVAEAKLDGAEETLAVPGDHWGIPRQPAVVGAVLRYLGGGRLAG